MRAICVCLFLVLVGVCTEVDGVELSSDIYELYLGSDHPSVNFTSLPKDREIFGQDRYPLFVFEVDGIAEFHFNEEEFKETFLEDPLDVPLAYNNSQIVWVRSDTIDEDGTNHFLYSTTLDNGATASINLALNTERSFQVPIAQREEELNTNCSATAATVTQLNCTCAENFTVERNSVKMTIRVANWQFHPYTSPDADYKRITLKGAFVFPTENSQLQIFGKEDFVYNTCNIADLEVPLVKDSGSLLYSQFRYSIVDDNRYVLVFLRFKDFDEFTLVDSLDVPQIRVPFEFSLHDFDDNIVYDPNFEVLLSSKASEDTDGTGDENDGDRSGDGDNTGIIVGTVVAIIFACIVVIAIVVIGAVLVSIQQRQRIRQLRKYSKPTL